MGKFVIKESGKGFSFSLKAGNGEIVAASSKLYPDITGVKAAIAAVAGSAPDAGIEDQTAGAEELKGAKFELYSDKAGEFRFRFKDAEGNILAVSEGYVKKDSAKNGIDSVRRNAKSSPVFEPVAE